MHNNTKKIASTEAIITVFESKEKVVKIVESGWPDRFHAITENGNTTNISYELLFIDEIKEKYNFDPIQVFEEYNIKKNIYETKIGTSNSVF